ncbi:restriction endonuclease subunit S [Lactiplantibacillus plantarum]|uniref:restriction endonuclease subunit S n=1 Tax=Lactiplantibacillus plantarum TaxID=1590 RepID=UPI0005FBFEF4|nr:restriction endonuclease subunit S [Lactiplantibacillus plantarum]
MNANQAKYPQLRFKGFTDPWVQRNLGDLAEIVRGASPRPIQDPKWFDDSSEIGWLRISDVTEQNGRIHHLDQHISEAGQAKTRVLTEPHLLLSIAATVGKPLVNYVKTGVHDGFLIFMNPKFDLEFMFQWLESYRDKWSRYGQPGSQVNLNSDLVKNQSISIPSMDEQQKLGEFFEKLDNLIAANQRKLDLLKEQKKGYLQKMFPKNGEKVPELRFAGFADAWEDRKFFESIASTIDFRGRTPKKLGMDWSESGYLALSALNVKNGYIDPLADAHYGDENLYKKWMSGKELKKGQVLFTTEAPMGNVAQVPDNNGYILSQRTVAFETKEDMMTNDFLAVLLKSPLVFNNLSALSSGGTAKGVSQKSLKGLSITVPFDIDEQQKIGSFFKQLDDTIARQQRKLEKLQELKKGYLQKMFC